VPTSLRLALDAPQPNPALGDLTVSFTLPGSDAAKLELLDIAGRRVYARDLLGLAPGRHTLRLDDAKRGAGVYIVRLTQKGHAVTTRATLLR